jgi:peroxin-2
MRAQDRIIQLQERRAREATGTSFGRIGSFFADSSTPTVRSSFRVGQLDTELLDEELLDLLKGQMWNGLKYFRVTVTRVRG